MSDQIQLKKEYIPGYGDLTELNTSRLILDTVGKATLRDIANNYLDLMETSGAIYEANGDYALGIFSSGWCQFLDSASRNLCNTKDNVAALKSGKWICHECCWNEASLESIKTKEPVDIECKGGIHLYAVPIIAGDNALGSMNMGYGDPPTDPERLQEISESYQVDFDEIARLANEYISRQPQIINAAKSQLVTSANLIGQIIERKQAEEELRESTHNLGERVKELNCLYGISELIEKEHTLEELLQGTANIIPPSWQYPEITCAIIFYCGEKYQTENYHETNWRQKSNIYINEKLVGSIMVCYLEERPKKDEGPFLKEERSLLDAITERLGKVAARYQAEEALQKAHDELEIRVKERTQELSIANEEMEKSSEKIKLFAYSVSHDLKNPAIVCCGLAKLLHKNYQETLDEKGKNLCDQILKSSEQIAALAERINFFISTKETTLRSERIKLKEVLQIIREEFSVPLNLRQIKWTEPEHMPEIRADRLAILRVLRNFVDNALKHGGDDLSRIEIGYKESIDYHILSITDDGKGLKKEDTKRIFGWFERQRTSQEVKGLGLGLAIVKEIVEQHKGEVWVEQPIPNKGITFCVSISKWLN